MFKDTYHSVREPDCKLNRQIGEDMPYRSQIGGVLYLNVCSRPDISFATIVLSSFNSNPRLQHWYALQALIRYINNTKEQGITYGKRTDDIKPNQLYIYVDADFANAKEGEQDAARSRTG